MKKTQKNTTQKLKKLLFVLVLLLLAEIAVVCYLEMRIILSEYRKEEQASSQLQMYIQLDGESNSGETQGTQSTYSEEDGTEATVEETASATEPTVPPVQYPSVDFASLTEINADVIGWIYIADTEINYPIVQGQDNRHYASTMVDGQDNAAGSIFMDYRNKPDFSDKHTVIYGHNMRNGSMFADILKYKKKGFLTAHPTGMIMTQDKNFQFEVLGGDVANLSDNAWQLEFGAEEEFSSWITESMSKSAVGEEVLISADDRILTLSTCSYEFSDARFVLVCRIIE